MDTKYFQQALEAYCKKSRYDSLMSLTPRLLSELLTEAQRLKQADIDATNKGTISHP